MEDGEKWFVGIIVLANFPDYFIGDHCLSYRSNSSTQIIKKSSENKEERNYSKDDKVISATNDGNYEQDENQQYTYITLKKAGERGGDNHVYSHLNEVQHDYVNQEEIGI